MKYGVQVLFLAQPSCFRDTVYSRTEKISVVHGSPGSAETSVRRDGITNQHLIAYSLSNISAKMLKIGQSASKLQCVTSVSFFETQCMMKISFVSVCMCAVPVCLVLSRLQRLNASTCKHHFIYTANLQQNIQIKRSQGQGHDRSSNQSHSRTFAGGLVNKVPT